MTSIPIAPEQRQAQKVIIRREGGQIVARSAWTKLMSADPGQISQMIAYVFANGLTVGRTWQETVRFVGDFEQDDKIAMVSNVRLVLDGRVRMKDGVAFADAYSIFADGQSNFSIVGGDWDNNGPNHVGVGSNGFHQFGCQITGCQDVVLEGMTLRNAGRDAFLFTGDTTRVRCFGLTSDTSEDDGFNPLDCSHVDFIGCHAKNHVFDGFHLSVGSVNVNVFGGSSTNNGDHSLKILGDLINVDGLICDGAMKFDPACGEATLQNCRFGPKAAAQEATRYAIYVANSSNTDLVRVLNNSVRGVTTVGDRCISVSGRTGTQVIGNAMRDNTCNYGIFVSSTDDCILRDNHVIGNHAIANIQLNGTCDNTEVTSNTSTGGEEGLRIKSTCTNTRIRANILDGTDSGGVDGLYDESASTIDGADW